MTRWAVVVAGCAVWASTGLVVAGLLVRQSVREDDAARRHAAAMRALGRACEGSSMPAGEQDR